MEKGVGIHQRRLIVRDVRRSGAFQLLGWVLVLGACAPDAGSLTRSRDMSVQDSNPCNDTTVDLPEDTPGERSQDDGPGDADPAAIDMPADDGASQADIDPDGAEEETQDTGALRIPSEIPDCLRGADPQGCAQPPDFDDWVCPDNWSPETVENGEPWEFSACRPPERVVCTGATAQFTSDDECVPIGTACPEDRFLSEEIIRTLAPGFDGPIYYVDDDGASESVYAMIGEAVAAIDAGGAIVHIAPGVHHESVEVEERIAFVGACPSDTVWEGADFREAVVIRESATLSNMTLVGAPALVSTSSPTLSLSSLVIDWDGQQGVRVFDGSIVALSDVVFRGVDRSFVLRFEGLCIDGAEAVTLERVLFDHGGGVFMRSVGQFSSTDLALIETDTRALELREVEEAQLENTLIAGTVEYGIYAADSTVEARNLSIREVEPGGDWNASVAFANSGGSARIENVLIEHVDIGINSLDISTRNVVVRSGVGVFAFSPSPGKRLELHQVVLDSEGTAIALLGVSVSGEDLVFRSGPEGWPQFAQSTGLTIDRLFCDSLLQVTESTGRLHDVRTHTLAVSSSDLEIDRLSTFGDATYGIWFVRSRINATDVFVRSEWWGVYSLSSSATIHGIGVAGTSGVGIFVSQEDDVDLVGPEDCTNRLDDDRDGATDCDDLHCLGHSSCNNPTQLDGVLILDTRLHPCGVDGTCIYDGVNHGGGMGLVVTSVGDQGSSVVLSDFLVARSARVGVVIDDPSTVEAHRGDITQNDVGVHVVDSDYDYSLLFDEVYIYDNLIDVNGGEVAIPDPDELLDW